MTQGISPQAVATDPLVKAYEDILYVGAPNVNSHPERLGVIAHLLGLDAARPSGSRVLELGCGDGGNLIPMAATMPNARFVGIDFAPTGIANACAMSRSIGLENIEFQVMDVREMPESFGQFDYIVAHGLYSWIPADVRRYVLPLVERHLAPNGVAFVSYNTYPGCHLRKPIWEMLEYHTRNIAGAKARLQAGRSLLALICEPADTSFGIDQALRESAKLTAQQNDFALYHDDMSDPNDPVYFHQFMADAERSGLVFLAESELHSMLGAGVTPAVRQALGRMERLAREQYLDFVHFRRFRQSLLCRAGAPARFNIHPAPLASMHVGARHALRNMASTGAFPEFLTSGPDRIVKDLVLARWPASVPVAEIGRSIGSAGDAGEPQSRSTELVVAQLFSAGLIDARFDASPAVAKPGKRPTAFGPARVQARTNEVVTTLWHEQARLELPFARELVTLLDGTRSRAELIAASAHLKREPNPGGFLERALEALARSALMVA